VTGGQALLGFLRRRWPILVTVLLLVVVASAVIAFRDYNQRPYVADGQLFVSALAVDRSSSGPSGQPLDLERAARLTAEDVRDVGSSAIVAADVARYLRVHGQGNISASRVMRWVSTTSSGSTVTISVTTSSPAQAMLASRRLLADLSVMRARFIGPAESARSSITIISPPSLSRAPTRDILTTFGLRLLLGTLVAVGLALAWDYLEDSVHAPEDVERLLTAPMLARAR